jgi:hypothetical protein
MVKSLKMAQSTKQTLIRLREMLKSRVIPQIKGGYPSLMLK